ncbi:MAG: ParA family protein [Planctomycetes bacterium]|nr:ParA family protein [Planctomycetota bacterium]
MRVLSLINQKGGCGKTTVAVNLAAALARKGQRVLLVDLDPQAHATLAMSCDGEAGLSLRDVLVSQKSVRRVIQRTRFGVDLLPAASNLAEFEETSARMLKPENTLRDALTAVAREYDWALLDCPARADGVLSANALRASSVAILVVETGAFALQGAVRARRIFESTARAQGSRFDTRVLGTLFDRRTKCGRELLLAMHARFGRDMFDTVIRESVKLRESAARGTPIPFLAPRSGAADDFASLAEELLVLRLVEGHDLSDAPVSKSRVRAPL